jgi:hypothetical protein
MIQSKSPGGLLEPSLLLQVALYHPASPLKKSTNKLFGSPSNPIRRMSRWGEGTPNPSGISWGEGGSPAERYSWEGCPGGAQEHGRNNHKTSLMDCQGAQSQFEVLGELEEARSFEAAL